MARYMRSDLGRGHTLLRPPVVVGAAAGGDVFAPIQGQLHPLGGAAAQHRRPRYSRLRPPVVVTGVEAGLARPLKIALARRSSISLPTSQLYPPVVLAAEAQAVVQPFRVVLAKRVPPPPTTVRLSSPVVVEQETEEPLAGLFGRLAPPPYRPTAMSLLRPPVVAEATATFVASRITTVLVKRRPLRVQSILGRPVVVHLAIEIYGPETTLARITVAPTFTKLSPPVVITQVVVETFSGPTTTLVPSRRPTSRSQLFPPAVVEAEEVAEAIQALYGLLAPQAPRPTTTTQLRPPVVVSAVAAEVYSGPSTTLAYSTRGKPRSILRPPIVVVQEGEGPFAGLLGRLASPPPRPTAMSLLRPPIVAAVAVQIYFGPHITLTYSSRPRAKWDLAAPTVVFAFVPIAEPLSVTLVRRPTPQILSTLRPPQVIDLRPQTRFLAVYLTYSQRRRPVYDLRSPVVVAAETGLAPLSINLTYSRRPRAKWGLAAPAVVNVVLFSAPPLQVYLARAVARRGDWSLRPPTVIDLRPQTRFLSVILTYSRRGRTKSFFLRPTVVGRASETRFLAIYLTYSRRGRPISKLRKPVVVQPQFFAPPLSVQLAYSRRGRPLVALREPVVVAPRPLAPPVSVYLTYSRRGAPRSILRKPVVIDLRPQTKFLSVNLTYSQRGRPVYELRPPVVVIIPIFAGPRVTLAPSFYGQPTYRLLPPIVVYPAFVAEPIVIWIARTPPKYPISKLRPPVVVSDFVPDRGDVCGFDEPITEACGETSASEATICGDDQASNTVCGSDGQAT